MIVRNAIAEQRSEKPPLGRNVAHTVEAIDQKPENINNDERITDRLVTQNPVLPRLLYTVWIRRPPHGIPLQQLRPIRDRRRAKGAADGDRE